MNHCSVARKITGFLQRQQCGYECVIVSREEQRPALAQQLDDLRIRFEHVQAGPQRNVGRELAAMIDRRVGLEAVALAGVEVVGAVAGRGVHEARARFERDVVAEDEDAFARQEGVAVAKVLEAPIL